MLLAGGRREALQRRLEQTVTLAGGDPRVEQTPELVVSFTLLEDLLADGPFEQIFVALRDPTELVNWLGHPAATAPTSGQGR